jgi:hypothetical protein
VINVNKTILGPVPYRGGGIGLDLGLFSVQEADLAAPFIDVLESVASIAGVAVVSTALPLIEPLKKGIDAITGMSMSATSTLEVGVSTTFDPPKPGWYIVMRARKQDVTVSQLSVTPSDYRLVDAATKRLVQAYPYMVFTVEQSKDRSDWFKLPDLTKPYQELRAAVRRGDYTATEELIATFKRSALTSDDLITDNAKRIGKLVQEQTEAVTRGTLTGRDEAGRELPPLESYPLYGSPSKNGDKLSENA